MLSEKFRGREYELKELSGLTGNGRAALIVIYGRRRVGKTRLLKESCQRKKHYWFEGLERGSEPEQIQHFLKQLAKQVKNKLLAKIKCADWHETFTLLSEQISKNNQIIIFDEFPWMIQKNPKTVALLKYFWDNEFKNKGHKIILCGSVNSFMVNHVIFSSAFYGRIDKEICLEPLVLPEIKGFFPSKLAKDVIDIAMIFGGIPRYLEEIHIRESVVQNINRLCFTKNAFFVQEMDRLFHDEFENTKVYVKIIKFLARHRSLGYTELLEKMRLKKGGGYEEYLNNLEKAKFIEAFVPYHKGQDTRLVRYRIVDEYLLFYFHFIEPNLKWIQNNTCENIFLNILGKQKWAIWSGFAFERLCIKHAMLIQKKLKIDQLVRSWGSYFSRKTNGFQIDLLFDRHDEIFTLCEMKYLNKPVPLKIIDDVEKKVELLKRSKKQEVEKVLITMSPPTKKLEDLHYFHKILYAEELLNS